VTFVIGESCIGTKDQSCVAVCPVDCIYETDHMLVIHPVECIDCGACEAECPVEAIRPDVDLPDGWEPFVAIGAVYPAGGREAAEALIAPIAAAKEGSL
jgi:ferredoxin